MTTPKPKPTHYTVREGGDWIAWRDAAPHTFHPNASTCHAIKFDDGSIFDMVNGWRELPAHQWYVRTHDGKCLLRYVIAAGDSFRLTSTRSSDCGLDTVEAATDLAKRASDAGYNAVILREQTP